MSPVPNLTDYLFIAPEVRLAIEAKQPVVALESTVIAHGLPHPTNLETFKSIEEAVRDAGAVPATVAIANGRIAVGAGAVLIDRLARAENVAKVGLGNMAATLARGQLGATTVAGTLWAAALAGIQVFATGGIGGRHHPTERSAHDVSSDLEALSRFPVVTVSSGVKSILDVVGTREELETRGVPVLGYGTERLPLFFSPPGQVEVDIKAEDGGDVARIARAHWGLRGGGVLLAVPCPSDESIPHEELEPVMRSLAGAMPRNVQGTRAATPWLLAALERATEGRTLRANIALLVNNARIAAEVAKALL